MIRGRYCKPRIKHPCPPKSSAGDHVAAAQDACGVNERITSRTAPFVSACLVEQGCAQVMTVPPNMNYRELVLRLRGGAGRESGRGL